MKFTHVKKWFSAMHTNWIQLSCKMKQLTWLLKTMFTLLNFVVYATLQNESDFYSLFKSVLFNVYLIQTLEKYLKKRDVYAMIKNPFLSPPVNAKSIFHASKKSSCNNKEDRMWYCFFKVTTSRKKIICLQFQVFLLHPKGAKEAQFSLQVSSKSIKNMQILKTTSLQNLKISAFMSSIFVREYTNTL